MEHIHNKVRQLFFALVAGMTVSCVGMKAPEVAVDVNILDVGSTPDTTTVELTARTDNAQAVSSCGFFWGKEMPLNRVDAELHPDGSFSSRISGLEPGTSFVFYAFISNGVDEKKSTILSFKTTARKEQPDNPDQPGTPPDDPNDPDNPDQPDRPDNPDQPDTPPDDPDEPGNPDQPDRPDDPGQPAVIPDQNFKSILLQKFDADGDGELSEFEISTVQNLTITNDAIESVEGIEYFKGLVRFSINGEDNTFGYYPSGNLTSVDISKNQNLLEFGIAHEKVTSVDISNNHDLIYLQLFSCPISSINMTGADNLVLFGAGYCKLKEFAIKDLKALDEVHLDHNVLTELVLENLPELLSLDCSGNQLRTLDLSGCPKIEALDCSDNPDLETVYLKKGQKLKSFTRDEGVKLAYLE